MNTIFAAILLALTLTASSIDIQPLQQNDTHKNWITLPSGLIVVEQRTGLWVLYSATLIQCSDWFSEYRMEVVFLEGSEGFPACYLVDTEPVGYFEGDPSDLKKFDLKMIPLTERTGDEKAKEED